MKLVYAPIFLQSHLQTTLLINECIALEMAIVNGVIRLVEPPGARKRPLYVL